MDWDLLVRLREVGARMVRLPPFLGAFRVHSAQKTSTLAPTVGIEEMQRIRRRLHWGAVDQGRGVATREDVSNPPRCSGPALPPRISQILSRWSFLGSTDGPGRPLAAAGAAAASSRRGDGAHAASHSHRLWGPNRFRSGTYFRPSAWRLSASTTMPLVVFRPRCDYTTRQPEAAARDRRLPA